jgi:hypothetical protein
MIRHASQPPGASSMAINLIVLQPLVALIAGILIGSSLFGVG